jgi:hypothetical protein
MVVPEAQESKVVLAKEAVSTSIVLIVGMLRSVGFNDQPLLEANEIDDIRPDDLLPPKLEGAEATVAEDRPQAFLSVGRVGAHPAGTGEEFLR